MQWNNISADNPRSFICGHCGSDIVSEKAFTSNTAARIFICHKCSKPNFFDQNGMQTPGSAFGDKVENISDNLVSELYEEARQCMSASAYTAAILCCRKLLMHIAVSMKAKEGQSFVYYVEFLSENNYIPPGAKNWVDQIREKGNEANHEIVLMKKEDAEELLSFIGMLLKIIYEFPARIKKKGETTV